MNISSYYLVISKIWNDLCEVIWETVKIENIKSTKNNYKKADILKP